jgi:hypothetical protein
VLVMLLTDPAASQKIVPAPAGVSLAPDEKVGDTDVQVVVATIPLPPNAPAGAGTPPKLTFYVGKGDHLLRRLTVSATQQGRSFVASESYSEVKADPAFPADAFTFTPAAGMTPVDAAPAPTAPPAPAPAKPAEAPKPVEAPRPTAPTPVPAPGKPSGGN